MNTSAFDLFFIKLTDCLDQGEFVKLTLGNRADKGKDLKNILVKEIEIKAGRRLSFTYRYGTKDVVKNYRNEEAVEILKGSTGRDFLQADLFTVRENISLSLVKGIGKIRIAEPTFVELPSLSHNKPKTRLIETSKNRYLRQLGVMDEKDQVIPSMQDKFRQINRYIEIIDSLVRNMKFPETFSVADMGSGKGYLTFALYDYLTNVLNIKASVLGVEVRGELVDLCSNIARECGYEHLAFRCGSIGSMVIDRVDMLIALHACDTATDEAIFKGITANASIIVCAPCCHKQIRKQIRLSNEIGLLIKHGILKERQAEIITDGLRALIMEAYGYKTKVFEFISLDHTARNVMIVGRKSLVPVNREQILSQVSTIRDFYGIKFHYLEKLLGIS
ncbi:MAG: SAM-dependent methyltransferase [Bacteroidetes bacterium]|nr:SAM-dependent methyltransferase [Bacteroidota bacterium]